MGSAMVGRTLVEMLVERFGDQKRAAQELDCAESNLTRWKTGYSFPNTDSLRRIAEVCPECRPFIQRLFMSQEVVG